MGLIQRLKNKNVFLDTAPYGLKTPDSIQIATAVNASADYFLTNDIRLKAVKEIEILVLDELIK